MEKHTLSLTRGDCQLIARLLQRELVRTNRELEVIDGELDGERFSALALHFDSVEVLFKMFDNI